jgi:type IV pilus assembly protein PilB
VSPPPHAAGSGLAPALHLVLAGCRARTDRRRDRIGQEDQRVKSRKIGEMLIELGLLDEPGLARALEIQGREGGTLGRIVSGLGFTDEDTITHAIADRYHLECVATPDVVQDAATLLPADFCRKRLIAPLRAEPRSLVLAMADPLDFVTIQDVEFRTNLKVVPAVASESVITTMLARLFSPSETVDEVVQMMSDAGVTAEVQAVEDEDDDRNVIKLAKDSEQPQTVRLVNGLLAGAVQDGASDVHLEPCERGVQVRYRIDGLLQNITQIPRHLQDATISRLKIMSGMDIAERRKPQDGRSQLKTDGRRIDLRVSTVPTHYGEKIVIRLLDSTNAQIAMKDLGLSPANLERLQTLLTHPTGMVLVTGPTGSGKTSTLYASLNWIKAPTKNIMTVEDPIEYRLAGVNQVGINPKAGVTFASALRSFLRQDPNVILVGEIRDRETASIALEASQTGHLLLSTVHTNDAAATVTRLLELGVEPFLLGSSVIGILAQRLVRRVCPDCSSIESPPDAIIDRLGGKDRMPVDAAWRKGRGCPSCRQSGYRGRLAIHELLEVTPHVRTLISSRAPDHAVREAARQGGMRTLVEDGIAKAAAGLTTLDEVLRVAPVDTLDASAPCPSHGAPPPPATMEPEVPAALRPPEVLAARAGMNGTHARVLVVDDSPTVVEVVKYFLELEGYDILVARDGAEGHEIAWRELPDAVVADVEMPRMDGNELVRALREDPRTAELPIMLLTSRTSVENETEGLSAGADDYVPKPVEPRRLTARVKALLGRHRAVACGSR